MQFYDEQRARSKRVRLAPSGMAADRWLGSFGWRRETGSVIVPAWAREGILQVGLMGATGTLEVDSLQLDSELR